MRRARQKPGLWLWGRDWAELDAGPCHPAGFLHSLKGCSGSVQGAVSKLNPVELFAGAQMLAFLSVCDLSQPSGAPVVLVPPRLWLHVVDTASGVLGCICVFRRRRPHLVSRILRERWQYTPALVLC